MMRLDAAFGHTRGLLGRLGGMIMARSTGRASQGQAIPARPFRTI